MALPSPARKVVLTAHVSTAVGWLGAVAACIALDITAMVSEDVQTVRAAYLAMEISAFYAIVPLAVASVLIGIVNALGTSWGLFQHYWVLVKLLLTLLATTSCWWKRRRSASWQKPQRAVAHKQQQPRSARREQHTAPVS